MHTKNVLPIAVSSVPEHVILTPLEPSGSEERCYTICWAAHHSKQGTSKDAGNNEGQEPQKPKLGASWLLQSPEWDTHPGRALEKQPQSILHTEGG